MMVFRKLVGETIATPCRAIRNIRHSTKAGFLDELIFAGFSPEFGVPRLPFAVCHGLA